MSWSRLIIEGLKKILGEKSYNEKNKTKILPFFFHFLDPLCNPSGKFFSGKLHFFEVTSELSWPLIYFEWTRRWCIQTSLEELEKRMVNCSQETCTKKLNFVKFQWFRIIWVHFSCWSCFINYFVVVCDFRYLGRKN